MIVRGDFIKSYLIIIAAVIFICAFIIGCGKLSSDPTESTGTVILSPEQTAADIETASPETSAATTSAETTAAETESIETAALKIDFTSLQKINPEIYAWIDIPGTVISYPVVQSADDNAFYLNHSSDGSYSAGGAIFTENYNDKDFTDRNTVIYGHYMKNGTLFTGLHIFIDADFFAEHRYVYIYTPEKTLSYKIFAVYPYDTRHLLLSFDYSNPYVFGKVFESVFKIRDMSARFADDVTLDREKDNVLTLSTCFYGDGTRRFLLQAVLLTDK